MPADDDPVDDSRVPLTLRINGEDRRLDVDPRTTLLDLLREGLGLTGSKKGCDHGQCGACTVLLDGRRANSCLVFALAAEGRAVTTIEGMALDGELHPLQQAFLDEDAYQCGYCTPGQLCSARGLLDELAEGWPSAVTGVGDAGNRTAGNRTAGNRTAGNRTAGAGTAGDDAGNGTAGDDAGNGTAGQAGLASPAEIRERMSGNLCRCGAYPHIVAAIQQVAERALGPAVTGSGHR